MQEVESREQATSATCGLSTTPPVLSASAFTASPSFYATASSPKSATHESSSPSSNALSDFRNGTSATTFWNGRPNDASSSYDGACADASTLFDCPGTVDTGSDSRSGSSFKAASLY
ncbi:hypothetical protein L0F63_005378 [Massospora cicadina]|nr:hypothetical protein L0F63_005378 [Massospora cicadina]